MYAGGWLKGKPHGPAVLRWNSGKVFEMEFLGGRLSKIVQLFESEKKYQDELKEREVLKLSEELDLKSMLR